MSHHPTENSAGIVMCVIWWKEESIVQLTFSWNRFEHTAIYFNMPILKVPHIVSPFYWFHCKVNIVRIIVLQWVLVEVAFLYYTTKVNCLILAFRNLVHGQSWLLKKIVVACTTKLFAIWTNQACGAMFLDITRLDIFRPKPLELCLVKIMMDSYHDY